MAKYKSAVSGKYVKKGYADKHPDTTYREGEKHKPRKPTKK